MYNTKQNPVKVNFKPFTPAPNVHTKFKKIDTGMS